MNDAKFISLLGEWERKIPFQEPGEYRRLFDQLEEAASPEHVLTMDGITVFDWGHCSCGWESEHYWDGVDLVCKDWREHVRSEICEEP